MVRTYRLGRTGTNTAAVATSFTDDSRFGGQGSTDRIEPGCRVLITAGTRAGDDVRVTARPVRTTGLTAVDPSFGAALDSTSVYAAFYPGIGYAVGDDNSLLDTLNAVLSEWPAVKLHIPITAVTDGDMRATGTTSWSEVGSGALSKVAATFPLGHRVLRMTGVAANDYILSATIPVEAGETYYLEALGMLASTAAAADTGTLVLYDETNAASISLDNLTIDRFEPTLLVNSAVSMPSGCKQVSVRLEADNAGDIVDWGWIIFRKNAQKRFVLADRQRIQRFGQVRGHTRTTWDDLTWNDMAEIPAKIVQQDANIYTLEVPYSCAGLSLWYEEIVRLPTVSAVTDTIPLLVEDIAAVAAEALLKPLRMQPEWAVSYQDAAREALRVRREWNDELRTSRRSSQQTVARLYTG